MPTADLNGIRIRYDIEGDGPPVLLSHGYSATGRMWTAQQRALADRYRVISWDMRGHGTTECPEDQKLYSTDLTVADMRELLRHAGAERAVIGGLSLGGYVSLAFAIAYPAMVQALVIADSGPGYRNPDARADWNRRAYDRAADLEARGLPVLSGRSREMREATAVRAERRPAVRAEHVEREASKTQTSAERGAPRGEQDTANEHRSAKGLALAARGMLAQDDARVIDGLPAIRVPTLVIVGDRDEPFLAPCRYMASKIPGARLEVIKDAGHSSNLDQPEAFNRVLRDFLDALS